MSNTPEVPGDFSEPSSRKGSAFKRISFEKLISRLRPTTQQVEIYNQTRSTLSPYELALRTLMFDLLNNAPAQSLIKHDPYQDIYSFAVRTNTGYITEVEIQARLELKKVAYQHFKIGGNTVEFNGEGQISRIAIDPRSPDRRRTYIQFPNAGQMLVVNYGFGKESFPVLPNGKCQYSQIPFPALAEAFVLDAAHETLPPRFLKQTQTPA